MKYLCSKFHKLSSNKNFLNRLRFDNVTESLKVETFLRHSVVWNSGTSTEGYILDRISERVAV